MILSFLVNSDHNQNTRFVSYFNSLWFIRTISFFTLLCILQFHGSCQVSSIPSPKVDLRVELLSIVFRLAGNQEYNSDVNTKYVEKIHVHFDKFKNHPLIQYAQQLRDSGKIGYDAVAAMAIHLTQVPDLKPIVSFSQATPEKRWNQAAAAKFALLLKQFYKDADCKTFFASSANDYKIAESRFLELFKKLDVNWYFKFFGKAPNEEFNIIIGLGNGGNNFGPQIDLENGRRRVYAIIGAGSFDSTGVPIFKAEYYLSTLVHEFNHSFVNYLTDKYETALSPSGELLYAKEGVKMRRQAYSNWKTMSSEALVRACVIKYLASYERDTSVAEKEMNQELGRGFVWMRALVQMLGQYEEKRVSFPTLESFMPKVIQFYDTLAPNVNNYEDYFVKQCARIIDIKPKIDSVTLVSPKTTEIIFDFDKRLDGKRYFFGPTQKGLEYYPKSPVFSFTNDSRTIVMHVKLTPDREYEINMIGRLMQTDEGYAVQDFVLRFKTDKQ